MKKKLLIIGSQGYLGSKLTDYFQERGYECTGVDVGFFQYGVLYAPHDIRCVRKSAGDVSEQDIKGYDVVLQLAGISNDPFGGLNPTNVYHPSRVYARNIASICKKHGVRYIFPSSCSVYGVGDVELNERGPTNPQTGYSRNKLEVESDLADLADGDFSPIALRLATVFGLSPRPRFDVVINMLCGMAVAEGKIILNSNGEAWRPHVYIEDVCEAFRCCVEWDYSKPELMILNVGRGENNLKIIDVAKLVKSCIPSCEVSFLVGDDQSNESNLIRDRKIHDGVDRRTYRVNFDAIHNVLPGFKAKWTVDAGVAQLLEDLRFFRLDAVKFRQRDFYRLQQLDFLSATKQLDLWQ